MKRQSASVLMLGQIDIQLQGQPVGKEGVFLFSDVLLIIAAALVLLLVLIMWAKYWRHRKPRRRHSQGRKVFRDSNPDEESPAPEDEAAAARRRYKYRYRRRDHRSRNPTLSETGGLPPTRPAEPTEPSR